MRESIKKYLTRYVLYSFFLLCLEAVFPGVIVYGKEKIFFVVIMMIILQVVGEKVVGFLTTRFGLLFGKYPYIPPSIFILCVYMRLVGTILIVNPLALFAAASVAGYHITGSIFVYILIANFLSLIAALFETEKGKKYA